MENSTENPGQPARSRRGWVILAGVLIVLLVAGAIAYPTLKQRWSAPLGPALELPTHTPTTQPPTSTSPAISQQSTAVLPEPGLSLTPTEAPTATPEPTATPQPLCGGPALMTILAVGVDTEDNNYTYGLGDAIRVARVDFVTPKITVLTMPRDLWVEIPGISDHYGITHGKLNQSYFYGSPGMNYYDGPGGGPGLMARTLDLNFGLRVDHYGALNMITFERIVDAVGGIDLYLESDVDGTPIDKGTEDMGYFYSGNNHFTGEEALRFSRIRKRYNDFTRGDFQNMVICALRNKLLTPAVLPKIPQIIAAFQDSVITDLSLEQMSQLACLLPSLSRENILFASLPQEIFTQGRVVSPQMGKETFILEADYDVIRDYVQKFMAGEWPNEPKEPTCE
ncbi:MAG: LCP family protein [Anaerolineales bacterium]|nr:LCP family protein [Anaerolineales bacterium]